MTIEEFNDNPDFCNLHDIAPPPCYTYIFTVFMELYNYSKEGVTWRDIDAWERVRGVRLRQSEIDVILNCTAWAGKAISDLKKDED